MPAEIKPPLTSFTERNKVQMVRGGKPYFDLLGSMIGKAKHIIHLQTYIYEEDETGMQVAEQLIAAAGRGVHVYVVLDGYASGDLSDEFTERLRKSGVRFRFFEPLFRGRNFYFGRRLHHKLVVADASFAMVGGINISNRYNDMPGQPAWLDFALYAEGDIAKQLCMLAQRAWKDFPEGMNMPACLQLPEVHLSSNGFNSKVRMRRNDWVRRRHQVSRSYLEMFRNAKSNISILSSYFLPGRVFRKSMANAAKRGVKFKVIVAGASDVGLAKRAEKFMYDWLLKNRIEIYEYQKNVLHGKVAVCDGEWVTIGSYNVNNISAYASIELNLDVQDAAFAKQAGQTLEQIMMNDCVLVTEENYRRTTHFFSRFLNWVSYNIIRVLFYMFTFYFKQQR
ncbi:MAG: phospholipase D-like domain-containing protein [Chitinophagaceae bacterium]|nr:phospholipase D-like domain-containing protein [Chitinophagaceae bacterium]